MAPRTYRIHSPELLCTLHARIYADGAGGSLHAAHATTQPREEREKGKKKEARSRGGDIPLRVEERPA